ncbi:nucleotidyltransferase family protein [Streptomyces sp. NPDC058268]|uniref:nucleotidyltransferase family protein n=1 Tax=Streptomyces sp. NPDC058268 TaxID=3346413 RepID=UPI0036EE5BB0
MNIPGAPHTLAGQSASSEPAGSVPVVLRWLCDPRSEPFAPTAHDLSPLGGILEWAIDAKLVCVLADRLLHGRHDVELTRAMRSFLAQLLRSNARRTHLHRGEAIRVVQALNRQGVSAAVLNGLAYDTELYPPGGLRQFTDIDLLVVPDDQETALGVLAELGFSEQGRGAHTRRRLTGDTLTRSISVDISTSLGHTADPADIRQALVGGHSVERSEAEGELPVLARADALWHALARLAARPRWTSVADASRLVLTSPDRVSAAAEVSMPDRAHAGWAVLRTYLPDLPLSPPATGTSELLEREERS